MLVKKTLGINTELICCMYGYRLAQSQWLDKSVSAVKVAGETGLEPATLGFGDRCSTN